MKSIFNKDKFIGIPNREEENNINHPNYTGNKDNKKYNNYQTPSNFNAKLTS